MAFPIVTEAGYHHSCGSFVVEVSASESYWYGPSEVLVSIHSVSLPLILHHCFVWTGMPMTLDRCNEVLSDAGIVSVIRSQVANRLLMDYTSSWFNPDADLVEYGLCPNITLNVYFISDSSSDSSSDSDVEFDHPHHPATREAIEALQEVYHLELDGQECSICLEPMLASMPVLGMPCSHFFHPHCLRTWLTVEGICPLCRLAL